MKRQYISLQLRFILLVHFSTGLYKSSKLTDKEALPNNWSSDYDLPAGKHTTFHGSITPETLTEGTTLYRVSGIDGGSGPWWTLEKPNNITDVIEGLAVRPEWNDYKYLYSYTVPSNVEIKCWKGKAAKQRITKGVNSPYLEGGTEQLWISNIDIQDPSFNPIEIQSATGW